MYDHTNQRILLFDGSGDSPPAPEPGPDPRLATRSNLFRRVVLAGIGAALVGTAYAVTPIAVTTCNPCNDISHLQGRAQWFAVNVPQSAGSIILVSSLSAPLSGFFKVNFVCSSGHCFRYVSAITTTTDQAFFIDANIFARSIKIPPIKGPTHNYNETDDELEAFLYAQFSYQNNTATDALHGLQTGLYTWYLMKDEQTGQLVQIWVGEMITFNYANGYSEKWQFLGVPAVGCRVGPGVPCEWRRVPNTLMRNGVIQNPPAPPPPPAKPVPNYGSVSGNTLVWPQATISLQANPYYCTGSSDLTITAPDGSSVTDTGWFVYPC